MSAHSRAIVALLLVSLFFSSLTTAAFAQVPQCNGLPPDGYPCDKVPETPAYRPGDILLSLTLPVELQTPMVAGQKPVLAVGTVLQQTRTYQNTVDGFSDPIEQRIATNAYGQGDSGGSSTGASFACVTNKSHPDFYTLDPINVSRDEPSYKYDWSWQIYVLDRARRTTSGVQFQIEGCSIGGFDAQNGYRQLENGFGQSTDSTNPRNKIGQNGTTGVETGQMNASIGFQAALASKQITVSGTVSQNYVGANEYAPGRGRYPIATDAYYQTASVAWWRTTSNTALRYSGSTGFQPEVGHVLWEYPRDTTGRVNITGAPYARYRCASSGCP